MVSYAEMLPMDSPIIDPGFDFNSFMLEIEMRNDFQHVHQTHTDPSLKLSLEEVSSPDSNFSSNECASSSSQSSSNEGVAVRVKCSNSAEPTRKVVITRSMVEQYFHESIDSAAFKLVSDSC